MGDVIQDKTKQLTRTTKTLCHNTDRYGKFDNSSEHESYSTLENLPLLFFFYVKCNYSSCRISKGKCRQTRHTHICHPVHFHKNVTEYWFKGAICPDSTSIVYIGPLLSIPVPSLEWEMMPQIIIINNNNDENL